MKTCMRRQQCSRDINDDGSLSFRAQIRIRTTGADANARWARHWRLAAGADEGSGAAAAPLSAAAVQSPDGSKHCFKRGSA